MNRMKFPINQSMMNYQNQVQIQYQMQFQNQMKIPFNYNQTSNQTTNNEDIYSVELPLDDEAIQEDKIKEELKNDKDFTNIVGGGTSYYAAFKKAYEIIDTQE